jgi:hypothetical protein
MIQGLRAHRPAARWPSTELHHAVGVGHRPDLLGPGGRGKHHVGEIRGLVEEDVLHDQVIERGDRLACVFEVGSDIAGFSPMMYMPRISRRFAAFMFQPPSAPVGVERSPNPSKPS